MRFNEIITRQNTDLSTTSGSYESLKYYDNNIMQIEYYPYQFDGWRDKKNYGVRYNKNIIYPRKNALKTYVNDNGTRQQNLLFVVDAFRELKSFIKERVKNEINKNSTSIYSRLDVRESYVDVDELYLRHLNITGNTFLNVYMPQYAPNGVSNIYEFAKHFAKFASITTKIAPLNRHLFIGSSFVPDAINGLTISFETGIDPLDVVTKANSYVAQDVFKNFMEIAPRFGFNVDRNFPWKIVADLSSPSMKNFYSAYSLKSEEDVFEKLYHKAYTVDIISLKNVFLTFWNKYVQEVAAVSSTKDIGSCAHSFGEITTLNFLDEKLFDHYFNINWQIRLYLFIRISEEKVNISQNKFETMHENACKINKIYNLQKSTEYINEQLELLKNTQIQEIYHDLTSINELDKVMKQTLLTTPPEMLVF